MAKILKKRNIPTVIAGMLAPPNLGKVYGTKFNNIYPSTSKKYGIVLYPLLLDCVAGII
jgi:acyl-CoA thioesterase-1